MRLWQLDQTKVQPRPEELKRVFRMISEEQLPDGTWKQVIITPRGRLIRLMDAAKQKVLTQDARNRPVTVAGKEAKAYADIWEGEEPVAKPQPRPEELRRTMQLKMISEKQMGDKKWYQVWEGPAGKIIKILSPDKKNVLQQYSPQRASLKSITRISQREQDRFSYIEGAEPNWEPLEHLFPDKETLSNFMFMGSIRLHTGTAVNLYKNSVTRRYINIDNSGNTYSYTGNDYTQIPLEIAKDYVLG